MNIIGLFGAVDTSLRQVNHHVTKKGSKQDVGIVDDREIRTHFDYSRPSS
jgi:hypothetical protein